MSRRTWINLAVFVAVFVGFLVWAARNVVTIEAIERPYEIAGDFEAASGVLPNAEVSYLGVRYGRVDSVDLREGGVRIHMKIDRSKRIPAEVRADVFRKSAIGEPYVLLTPPPGYEEDGQFLEKGAIIPQEHTSIPLEFSEMLRSASRLLSAIPPEAAGNLIHELAVGLAGREESLRQLTVAGDTLSETFAERTEALDRLAENNTRLTRVVAAHRNSLVQSLDDLRQVASSLRAAEGDLVRLLDDGPELVGRTAEIVSAQKGNLDCILKDLEKVIDVATTDVRIAGLETLVTVGPQAFAGLWDTRDEEPDGVWIRVGLIANPENPAQQYVPAKTVPETREVPPCQSGLVAASGSFTPRPVQPGGGTIPATGGSALAIAGLVLLAAAVVLRSTSRETK